MELVQSLEVRWFFGAEDAVVPELKSWFEQAPLDDDGKREDHYFVDPERRDLNAKSRGGAKPKFECKYRTSVLESMCLTPNVAGHVERWNKLSLSVDAGLAGRAQIIAVNKERKLRKFAFDGRVVREVSVEQRPAAGCGVEVTMIRGTRGSDVHAACSLGFEAFGPAPLELEALVGAARLVFHERPELQLDTRQSDNYSGWLLRHFVR